MARFVLVHGAFGGAWCWARVAPLLEAGGHIVKTFDLPGNGEDQTPVEEVTLQSCAERVCDVLESDDEEAVLVGISMGGVIATQAAALAPGSVDSIVFVAAFMPANGQSLLDLADYPEGAGNQLKENMVIGGEPPVATLSPEAATAAIYNCCTAEQVAYALERRRPQAVAPFATPVTIDDEAFESIRRSYVMTR